MTFISVDTQLFASRGILLGQQTTINIVLLYIRDSKISITEDTCSVLRRVDLRLYGTFSRNIFKVINKYK